MEETVTIATPDHVDLEFDLAGLGSRFAAYVIDMLCLSALALLLIIVAIVGLGLGNLGALLRAAPGGEQWVAPWAIAIVTIMFLLLQWGYFLFFERLMRGRTPGKKALGIRVLRDDGLPITLREAALRNLVRAADMLPPPSYLLAGVVMHIDRQGRRLGDMVAGTLVVRERFVDKTETAADTNWGATWMTRLEHGQSGHLTLPGGTINAAQLGLIEQFLQRQKTLSPTRRTELAQQILAALEPMLGAEWQPQSDRPEEILRHILAMARDATATSGRSAGNTGDGEEKRRHWQQFRRTAQQLLHGGQRALRSLTAEELRTFVSDYRRITVDLARARSLGAEPQTLTELNRLVVMGHNVLYGYRRRPSIGHWRVWFTGFPRAVRENSSAFLLSACMLFAPALISYVAIQWHPELAYDLVAEGFLDFAPTDEEHLHHIPGLFQPIAASSILANNIQVSLLAFGFGLTAGVGTVVVLVFNGLHLGAIFGWLSLQGYSHALWGWIMPHGGTELLAIMLSGGAGLMLAKAILAPGEVRRSTALKRVAPRALHIELGCMVMLVIAGLIEGFVSPSSIGYAARVAVLACSLCGWCVYFTCVGVTKKALDEFR
ncbi:MAG: stage II sporulation protein M, partial [Candidatus Tectomicrobia bacterium]